MTRTGTFQPRSSRFRTSRARAVARSWSWPCGRWCTASRCAMWGRSRIQRRWSTSGGWGWRANRTAPGGSTRAIVGVRTLVVAPDHPRPAQASETRATGASSVQYSLRTMRTELERQVIVRLTDGRLPGGGRLLALVPTGTSGLNRQIPLVHKRPQDQHSCFGDA